MISFIIRLIGAVLAGVGMAFVAYAGVYDRTALLLPGVTLALIGIIIVLFWPQPGGNS